MNLKQLQIDAIEAHINHIKRLNVMMEENYGMYANQPGWDALDHPYLVNLCKGDTLAIIRDGLKPFLRDMYIKMNEEIISSFQYQLRKLDDENN
ncbi:hypothetical protein MAR005P1_00130 [Escherichia virus vB_Eco_mar005P1]|nr:hypothetical protein MAR007P3_00180 [Escherichia virus vB_Eco_mar005P1]VCU44034.1 hypothetical protein MAR008P4_00145 [Escherichia virus vB_Eco_mar005P1]VCU44197.1 hypothetical protein MAR006P2_00039 [Escherichia virus vB_Eco_mar005P1]VCU44554.1 hypothetical protein MAR005P1_00130 [Escherichia virus vB_Eco_mar005P1]VCU44747.1 hypothetical protein MAR009P5_00054 [Escherichia virus vB_Eco_mar005P1]